MNCEINVDNDTLRKIPEDERKQLTDGIDFVYATILLNSATTVLGKNINYNRDIIKTISINNVPYYIHPILSKRGIDTVFKVSIKVIRNSLIDNPIAIFKGEYNSLLNFSEEIEQLNDSIKNPKPADSVEPKEDGNSVKANPQTEESKDETKEEPNETTNESSNAKSLNISENETTESVGSNSLPEEPKNELKEESIAPTPNSSIDNSSDDSENEKTESSSTQTPLAASYTPTLHNVGVEFPSDKKVEKKTKSHSLFSSRKKKSRKKNK